MKLLFKQRFFSWFDSFDIFDERGNVFYTVKGQLSWGHLLKIYDSNNDYVGMVKQRVLTLLPKFEIYSKDNYVGVVNKEFTFFKDKYYLDFEDWRVDGDLLGWNYVVLDGRNNVIMKVQKELLNFTDTYTMDIIDEENALYCVMIVLAIDAAKCSSKNNN